VVFRPEDGKIILHGQCPVKTRTGEFFGGSFKDETLKDETLEDPSLEDATQADLAGEKRREKIERAVTLVML
jgi:hypothetical protein